MAKAQRSPIQIAESDNTETAADQNILLSGDGGGTMDGMNERVVRLEERTELFGKQLERIVAQLDAVNAKLATLPSKEFLIGSIIGALAIALAIASLTFAIADYAAKKAAPNTPSTPVTNPAPPQQPMIIVVPSLSAVPTIPQPAPVAPTAPTP